MLMPGMRVFVTRASGFAGRHLVAHLHTAGDDVTDRRVDVTDHVAVTDVVRAYRSLSVHGVAGEIYNVCSGRARVVRQSAEQLLSRSPHRMRMETDTELFRPADVPEIRGDPSKLQKATGWMPRIAMSESLDDLLDHRRYRTAPRSQAAGLHEPPLPDSPLPHTAR